MDPILLFYACSLQMRLMLWAMDLYHQIARFFFSPDYFSRLGVDLHFDEMSRLYMSKTVELRNLYPPVSGVMRPENMPGYRTPRVRTDLPQNNPTRSVTSDAPGSVDPAIAPLLTSIMIDKSGGHRFVSR